MQNNRCDSSLNGYLIVFEPLISDFGIHLEIPRTAFDDDVDCAIESEMFASENQFARILDPTGI